MYTKYNCGRTKSYTDKKMKIKTNKQLDKHSTLINTYTDKKMKIKTNKQLDKHSTLINT